jgi:CDGSH-type Zn-finger protein/uncharacterized Fe-S cluster protein YjdI
MEKHYDNGEVTVVWKPDLCIHSANWVKGLPEVFDNRAKPWINIKGAGTDRIIDQVKKCPSGALSFIMNEKKEQPTETENLPGKVKMTTMKDGPIMVEGDVSLCRADGSELPSKKKVFLCRCGYSSNKPFCDGSHKKEGFTAD